MQAYKPGSVVLLKIQRLIIYLDVLLPKRSICLPSSNERELLNAGIRDISPHRVYLVSLQHYLYILSVALVHTLRQMGVTHYIALWCPDFPLNLKAIASVITCAKILKECF